MYYHWQHKKLEFVASIYHIYTCYYTIGVYFKITESLQTHFKALIVTQCLAMSFTINILAVL